MKKTPIPTASLTRSRKAPPSSLIRSQLSSLVARTEEEQAFFDLSSAGLSCLAVPET